MADVDRFQKFFESFDTIPKLVSDLALSIAVAQQRMDVAYLRSLREIAELAKPLLKDDAKVTEFITMFKAIAPARYQFTETIVEVRADMQLSTGQQFTIGVTAPFAVAVNASYTRRTASDYRASALIRTVIQAVSADPGTMQSLLNAAKEAPGTVLPKEMSDAQKAIQDALMELGKATEGGTFGDKKPGEEKKPGEGEKPGGEKPAELGAGAAKPAGGAATDAGAK